MSSREWLSIKGCMLGMAAALQMPWNMPFSSVSLLSALTSPIGCLPGGPWGHLCFYTSPTTGRKQAWPPLRSSGLWVWSHLSICFVGVKWNSSHLSHFLSSLHYLIHFACGFQNHIMSMIFSHILGEASSWWLWGEETSLPARDLWKKESFTTFIIRLRFSTR